MPLESVVCPPQAAAVDPLAVESEELEDDPELKEVEKEEPNEEDWDEFRPLRKPEDAPTGLPKFETTAWAGRAALRHFVFKLPINTPPGPR